MADQEGRCSICGRPKEVTPATFKDWMTMIRPQNEVVEVISREELLATHVDGYLAYLSRPDFPQRFHTLWKDHIEEVRSLQRESFDFFPSHMALGQMTFREHIQETRERAMWLYPELDEHRRYCKMLDKYSELLLIWFSSTDYARFNDLRIRQNVTTRRRLFFETWEIIREYGTSNHPMLDPFTPAD